MRIIRLIILIVVLAVGGCVSRQPGMTQISTIDALLAGDYNGHMTLEQLLGYGDFGLGTFDRLDGEMLIWQGVVYQIRADGKVYFPPLTTKVPFATVVRFANPEIHAVRNMSLAELYHHLDMLFPDQNQFYAIRVHGDFKYVATRSVPAQSHPYPPLKEVSQETFRIGSTRGNLIGFRCPPFARGINVPGYHFHFLDADKESGGHVLDLHLIHGTAEVLSCRTFYLILPEDRSTQQMLDLSKDRSGELRKVEMHRE